jgi:integrase
MLTAAVERYIELHLAVGYRFRSESLILRSFARHATAQGDMQLRSQTALAWAAEGSSAAVRRKRLLVVRRFSRRMQLEEKGHPLPQPDSFGPREPGRTPYIFAPDSIRTLLAKAAALGPTGSLRPKTYATLFGLMACTGLRISEALALHLEDISADGLVIRLTKFKKSRLVPMHPTCRRVLDAYLVARRQNARQDTAVFLSELGTRLRYPTVNATFLRLVREMGIHPGPGKSGPRLHDLRHGFAVRSLDRCLGDRAAIARHMLALSTYLGHARLSNTYWYLHATPHLLAGVARQGESLATRGVR